jgi:endonuclease VIII
MEGPSLALAAEQLAPFKGKTVKAVSGNTTIGKERLVDEKVRDIFSWGKNLVFQFDTFALRFHFMLFGTFTAEVKGKSVTGDYLGKSKIPRLMMEFSNGHIKTYNCSIKVFEHENFKSTYDFGTDLMSPAWDGERALARLKTQGGEEIGDVILDQTIFSGAGNIIKNEVLFLARVHPEKKVRHLPLKKLKEITGLVHTYSHQFYEWRKKFELKKHYQAYRKSACPVCQGKITRKKTGVRERWSFFCPACQN